MKKVTLFDVRTIIGRARDAGAAVFLNSHLLTEVERVCDRVAVVDHGRIIAEGVPQELIARLGEPKVITHHGTLEDVFMSLTGRHLRDD